MTRPINIRIADPAGNITLFVLDRIDRRNYAAVAKALFGKRYFAEGRELAPEQIAFVTGPTSMEMCGLEFCGNATRAFALMCAESGQVRLPEGGGPISVQVSGTPDPLIVTVMPESGFTKVRMPGHRSVSNFDRGTLVQYDGIAQLVLEEDASDARFEELRGKIAAAFDPPAIGVMFCKDTEEDAGRASDAPDAEIIRMTPVVYVRDVNTVYHEGSCGSGTTAAAVARSSGKPDGTYRYDVCQPAGTLIATAAVENGAVTAVWIEGDVRLYPPETVEIDL